MFINSHCVTSKQQICEASVGLTTRHASLFSFPMIAACTLSTLGFLHVHTSRHGGLPRVVVFWGVFMAIYDFLLQAFTVFTLKGKKLRSSWLIHSM